jgi:hypothetical protein
MRIVVSALADRRAAHLHIAGGDCGKDLRHRPEAHDLDVEPLVAEETLLLGDEKPFSWAMKMPASDTAPMAPTLSARRGLSGTVCAMAGAPASSNAVAKATANAIRAERTVMTTLSPCISPVDQA